MRLIKIDTNLLNFKILWGYLYYFSSYANLKGGMVHLKTHQSLECRIFGLLYLNA